MQFKAQTKAQLKIKNLRTTPSGNGFYWIRVNASMINGNLIQEMLQLSKDMKIEYIEQKTGSKYTDFLIDTRVYDEYVKDVPADEDVIIYY